MAAGQRTDPGARLSRYGRRVESLHRRRLVVVETEVDEKAISYRAARRGGAAALNLGDADLVQVADAGRPGASPVEEVEPVASQARTHLQLAGGRRDQGAGRPAHFDSPGIAPGAEARHRKRQGDIRLAVAADDGRGRRGTSADFAGDGVYAAAKPVEARAERGGRVVAPEERQQHWRRDNARRPFEQAARSHGQTANLLGGEVAAENGYLVQHEIRRRQPVAASPNAQDRVGDRVECVTHGVRELSRDFSVEVAHGAPGVPRRGEVTPLGRAVEPRDLHMSAALLGSAELSARPAPVVAPEPAEAEHGRRV